MDKTEFRQRAALAVIGNIQNIWQVPESMLLRIAKDFELDLKKDKDIFKAVSLGLAELVDTFSSDITDQVFSNSLD